MNIYYVYFYLRSDFTPYYVGKGKNKRAWIKGNREIKPPKDKSKIILVEQNLTDIQAFILERYYIRWFGRKDLGTGILRNMTDGGEGVDSRTARKIAQDRVKNKTHNWLKKEDGSSLGQKICQIQIEQNKHPFQKDKNGSSPGIRANLKNIENGTHPFLKKGDGNSLGKIVANERIKNGTHNFQTISFEERSKRGKDISKKLLQEGRHNLQKREDGSSVASDRVKNETHNLLNSVSCFDETGKCIQIPKEIYFSQTGPKENWKWKQISTGTVTARNKKGDCKNIPLSVYNSQTGPREDWEWIAVNSKEGKMRKNSNDTMNNIA